MRLVGTESAAATYAMEYGKSLFHDRPPCVRVDHPFLLIIRDNITGTVLFMGRVVNPSA